MVELEVKEQVGMKSFDRAQASEPQASGLRVHYFESTLHLTSTSPMKLITQGCHINEMYEMSMMHSVPQSSCLSACSPMRPHNPSSSSICNGCIRSCRYHMHSRERLTSRRRPASFAAAPDSKTESMSSSGTPPVSGTTYVDQRYAAKQALANRPNVALDLMVRNKKLQEMKRLTVRTCPSVRE